MPNMSENRQMKYLISQESTLKYKTVIQNDCIIWRDLAAEALEIQSETRTFCCAINSTHIFVMVIWHLFSMHTFIVYFPFSFKALLSAEVSYPYLYKFQF